MFGEQAFRTWPHVLLGALWFAGLFGLAALMADRLFNGNFEPTRRVWALAVAAFIGYIGTAMLIRSGSRPPPGEV